MPASSRKAVSDLPQFLIRSVHRWEGETDGFCTFDLTGVFDRSEGVQDGMCWLLLSAEESYYGELSSFDSAGRTATFRTDVKNAPESKDKTFYYLSAYWQAYHVWMVADVNRAWKSVLFHSSDAAAVRFTDNEGKGWRKLSKASTLPGVASTGEILKDGWDHEHCELCNAHIDPGDVGYIDTDEHWVCASCYESFVARHDLSFINDL